MLANIGFKIFDQGMHKHTLASMQVQPRASMTLDRRKGNQLLKVETRDIGPFVDTMCYTHYSDTIPVKVYTRKKKRVNETDLEQFNSIFGYWLDPLGQSSSGKMEWWGAVYKPISRSS